MIIRKNGEVVYLCIFRIKFDDDWRAVCVIDGRQYSTPSEVHRLAAEALEEISGLGYVSELEKVALYEGDPSASLPTWERYCSELRQIGPL